VSRKRRALLLVCLSAALWGVLALLALLAWLFTRWWLLIVLLWALALAQGH